MTAVVSRRVITAKPKAPPKAPKKRINRPGCIARLHKLWQQEWDLGHEPPAAERTINLDTLSDDDLVSLGKRVAARVQGDATVLGDLVVKLVMRGELEMAHRQALRIADKREREGMAEFVNWFVVGKIEAVQGSGQTSATICHPISDLLARLEQARKPSRPAQKRNGPAPRVAGEELFPDTPSLLSPEALARVQADGAAGTLVGGEDDAGRFWWCDLDETPIAGPFPDEWAAQVWVQPALASREVSDGSEETTTSTRPAVAEQQGPQVVAASPRTVRVKECSGSQPQPQQLPPLDGYTWWYRSGEWYAATDLAPGTMVGRFRSEKEARRACCSHASERRARRWRYEQEQTDGHFAVPAVEQHGVCDRLEDAAALQEQGGARVGDGGVSALPPGVPGVEPPPKHDAGDAPAPGLP